MLCGLAHLGCEPLWPSLCYLSQRDVQPSTEIRATSATPWQATSPAFLHHTRLRVFKLRLSQAVSQTHLVAMCQVMASRAAEQRRPSVAPAGTLLSMILHLHVLFVLSLCATAPFWHLQPQLSSHLTFCFSGLTWAHSINGRGGH